MSRRRKQHESEHHDRWLVSYADFITLLFAFFVVLYSTSQVDKRKAGMLARSIQVAFQQFGAFDGSHRKIALGDPEGIAFYTVPVSDDSGRTGQLGRFVQNIGGQLPSAEIAKKQANIEIQLASALSPEIQKHFVEISLGHDGVIISLREIGFYDIGSAKLRSSSQGAVERLAGVLKMRPESLRIEGHTDNVSIHNAQFDSNWELSTARASDFVKALMLQYSFPPGRLSAAGYAEFHPVASNKTAEGRAQNRRVDVVVLNSSSRASRTASTDDFSAH